MTDTATTVDPETVAASFCADHLAAVELLLARQINGLASDVQGQGLKQDDQATDCPGPPRQLIFGALQSRLAVETARLACSTATDLYLL